MNRHEIPISAGLTANGNMISVRNTLCANPARISNIANPSAANIVQTTSITTNRNVTRITVQNTGSSVNAIM